jgi:hypothetical protein
LLLYQLVGWDPVRDDEIGPGDPMPEKPWIALFITTISGRGHKIKSRPVLFVTHHALSRAAQRFGLRTQAHMLTA